MYQFEIFCKHVKSLEYRHNSITLPPKTTATYKTKQGAKLAVFKGIIMKSKGGLKKDALTKNKYGRIVSKKASLKSKKSKWMAAVAKARTALKVKGFTAVGGKTAAGAFLHRFNFNF